jgi:hydrogenase maturation factor
MSKEVDNLRQLLARRFNDAASGSCYGIVKKVDEEKRTCDVQIGGIVREKVMLYLIDDPEEPKKGWWFVPKVESIVLITRVDAAGTRLRVSMFSEIDWIVCTTGETEFSVGKDGYKLNRGQSGLLKTLRDLCAALEQLTVSTAMGPSGVPINIAEFTRIKQDLNNWLEE